MKKQFSKYWNSSKQPRKQRKYRANAPLHIKRKLMSANLSKTLRERHSRRTISLRKGDVVRIMRGSFKGKKGKITKVDLTYTRVIIEGMQRSKKDGTKVNVSFRPSNLQIQELNLEDRKRLKAKEGKIEEKKVEIKEVEKKTEKKVEVKEKKETKEKK